MPPMVTGLGVATGVAPLVKSIVYGPPVTPLASVRFRVHWFWLTLANDADMVTLLPCASNVVIEDTIGFGLRVSAGRLPVTVAWLLACGGTWVPGGSETGPCAAFVFTTLAAFAAQPCTTLPSEVTSEPLASKLNDPFRVNSCCPALSTTKKPSPWIIRSVLRPVFWVAPWLKLFSMPPSRTPSPTCAGLVPPLPFCGVPAERTIWLSVSWNVVWLDLYPVVLTLAMLFRVTSIICWCARRPLMPENRGRSILVCAFLRWGAGQPADWRTSVTEDSGTSLLPTLRVGSLPERVADVTTPVAVIPSGGG